MWWVEVRSVGAIVVDNLGIFGECGRGDGVLGVVLVASALLGYSEVRHIQQCRVVCHGVVCSALEILEMRGQRIRETKAETGVTHLLVGILIHVVVIINGSSGLLGGHEKVGSGGIEVLGGVVNISESVIVDGGIGHEGIVLSEIGEVAMFKV